MRHILIVEDTPREADALVACLHRYEAEKGMRFSVNVVTSAVEFAERKPVADLIFMDIDMPGMTGMEAAEELRERDKATPLIFVTNLAQYAVHGYAVDALDFMVKPVDYTSFRLRMDRAVRAMERMTTETLAIRDREGAHMVPLNDICFVELVGHDLHFHLAEGQVLRMRGSIRSIAPQLGSAFLAITSGCLVNMGQIKLARQASLVMATGDELFYSRDRRKTCVDAITAYASRYL